MLQDLFARIGRALNSDDEERSDAPPRTETDELRVEVEMEAQRTLDQIDDALTAWQQLELRLERERNGVALWERKAERAEAEASNHAADALSRSTWGDLRDQAQAEAAGRRERVRVLAEVMEQARPSVEEALRLIEAIGFSRDKALSLIDRLELTQATAEVKQRLASARLSGEVSRIEALLRSASEQVDAAAANADATEELANYLG
jgi:hypothetical protein